jgi:hypothetical protein
MAWDSQFSRLSIHQNARQHDRAAFAASNVCLLGQGFGLCVIALRKEDLREQPHGVDIAAFRGFLGPQRGLLAVAGAEVRIGKIILGRITGFRLFPILAAYLIGAGEGC